MTDLHQVVHIKLSKGPGFPIPAEERKVHAVALVQAQCTVYNRTKRPKPHLSSWNTTRLLYALVAAASNTEVALHSPHKEKIGGTHTVDIDAVQLTGN